MTPQLVFTKTAAGRDALTSRPPELGPRLRSLLIMIDGKRDVAEFDKLLGGSGSAEPLLAQLQSHGWIAAEGPAPAPAPVAPAAGPVHAAAAAAGAPVAAAVLPFADARRLAVRFVNDQLGPMGETIAMKIEACKSPAELQAALPRIRDGLRNFKNNACVQQFDAEVASRLPTA